jgi:hypothetical protein
MDAAQVRAMGPTLPMDVANEMFRLSRATGYRAAARGEYPCKVIRVGTVWRVVTESLIEALELDRAAPTGVGRS